MSEYDQELIKFSYEKNLTNQDFYISKSNKHIFDFLEMWPKWNKKFLNIIGEKFSGKTHLINIFIKKFNGIRLESKSLNEEKLNSIRAYQNIILEDLDLDINEELIYSLFNLVEQNNKFLIITSLKPVVEISFKLDDLRSRTKNCLLAKIENPDDELMFALILKNFSDRQILIDKKLIDFIIKRIDRSYDKIFEFIYKIDELSLKKKKPIDFKSIKEVLKA